MNSKIVIIIACLVVVGGAFAAVHFGTRPVVNITPIENTTPVVNTTPVIPTSNETYLDIPLNEDFEIRPGIVMDKALAPAYFEFGSAIPGATIDTWTRNGTVIIGQEQISYVVGSQMWILLYNGLEHSATFSVYCINAPLDINHSDVTGKDYRKAPEGSLGGVTFPSMVTVQPRSCKKVPISIQLPKGLDYPDQWEFRLLVTDLEVPGQVGTALELRFFYTMR